MKDDRITDFWREKGNFSKSLILLELGKGNSKLVEIGKSVGITTQAVSFYVKELQKEGLIDSTLKVTQSGMEYIQKFLSSMSYFVSKAYSESGILLSCEAIANEDIRSGDRVYLFMDNGDLFATKKKIEGSTGISLDSAKKGEAIRVEKLEGIVKIDYGKIFMLEADLQFYRSKDSLSKVLKFISSKRVEKIFIFGTVAKLFADKLGKEFCDFAPVDGAYEAAIRGLNTLLIYSPEVLRFVYLKIAENVNKYGLNPISVEL